MKTLSVQSSPASSPVVSALVSEIVKLHGEIITAARTSLDKAIRIGELLIAQKKQLVHGRWLDFVSGELPFSERTAQNYMRCYAERARLKSANVADLGKAYRLLAEAVEPGQEPAKRTTPTIDVEAKVTPGAATSGTCPPRPTSRERIVGFAPGSLESTGGIKPAQDFAIQIERIVDQALEANASAAQLKALSLACQAGAKKASEAAKGKKPGS